MALGPRVCDAQAGRRENECAARIRPVAPEKVRQRRHTRQYHRPTPAGYHTGHQRARAVLLRHLLRPSRSAAALGDSGPDDAKVAGHGADARRGHLHDLSLLGGLAAKETGRTVQPHDPLALISYVQSDLALGPFECKSIEGSQAYSAQRKDDAKSRPPATVSLSFVSVQGANLVPPRARSVRASSDAAVVLRLQPVSRSFMLETTACSPSPVRRKRGGGSILISWESHCHIGCASEFAGGVISCSRHYSADMTATACGERALSMPASPRTNVLKLKKS